MNSSISRSLQMRDDRVAVQSNDSPGHQPARPHRAQVPGSAGRPGPV